MQVAVIIFDRHARIPDAGEVFQLYNRVGKLPRKLYNGFGNFMVDIFHPACFFMANRLYGSQSLLLLQGTAEGTKLAPAF